MNPDGPTRASEQKREQAATGGGRPPAFQGVNANAELVADLLAATGLLPEDKLNLVKGATGSGSLAQAIVDEGYAVSEGVARMLAARHHMPLVDLPLTGVDKQATERIPLHVLERLVAIPYALEGNSLRVAIADPSDLHAIDELRLATRHQVELSVASRDDILAEIRRLSRASEAFGARAVLEEEAAALEELGLSDEMRERLEGIISRPTGALLVTGPTGSGKSTTLYASLAEINKPDINIITVEDPVEYRLAGINQVQINPRAGLTFAAALRSILRSDPDVVMVGEIRDGETAKIAIE